jgi:phosphatidylethanolamine/phosphatidyl-N-methylethanolamine N-methyltransferase
MMDAKKVQRVYAVYSGFYDLIFGKMFHEPRTQAIELLGLKPGHRVLEVGVGTGLSLPIYPAHCEVTGIDLSSQMLKKGKAKVARYNLGHVRLHQMDATRMTFSADSFDAVMAAYVISTVPQPHQVIREMLRVCKPGGKIVFLNHFTNGNRLVSSIERTLSPLCKQIGFRTDLDIHSLLTGLPVRIHRIQKVKPLNYWAVVQCTNQKRPV